MPASTKPPASTTPPTTPAATAVSTVNTTADPLAMALKGAPQPAIQAAATEIKKSIVTDVTTLTDLANGGKANPDAVKVLQGDLTTKIGTLSAVNNLITPAPSTPGVTPTPSTMMINVTDANLDVQALVSAASGDRNAVIQHFANDLGTNLGITNGTINSTKPLNLEDIRDDFTQLNAVLNAQGGMIPKEVITAQAMDVLENLGIDPKQLQTATSAAKA